MNWLRLWHDMPNDTKWPAIARKAGQPIATVIAVYNFVLVNASSNEQNRGTLKNWDSDDVAAFLQLPCEDIEAIFSAMQGKVLDGNRLTGWEDRQPKKEDPSAAERAKEWREKKKADACERTRTLPNATVQQEKIREDLETEAASAALPETTQTVQHLHPGTDSDFIAKIAAAAEQARPGTTDNELADALHKTHKGPRQQKSAGLWLHTIPAYLRSIPPNPASLPRSDPEEQPRSRAEILENALSISPGASRADEWRAELAALRAAEAQRKQPTNIHPIDIARSAAR